MDDQMRMDREINAKRAAERSEIARLTALLSDAREALKPFCGMAAITPGGGVVSATISVTQADLIRARSVLAKMEEG